METKRCIKPGEPGTIGLMKQYGEALVCVRYKYDINKKKRYKTIELIIDEKPWEPKKIKSPLSNEIVGIRIAYGEANLAGIVKKAGGIWNREKKVWEIPYFKVKALKLEKRMI